MGEVRFRSWLLLVLAIGPVTACGLGEVAGPGQTVRRPGALLLMESPASFTNGGTGAGFTWTHSPEPTDVVPPEVLSAPDTVDAGRAFLVVTYTVGLNGCWREDGQTKQMLGRTIVLKPYDSHSGAEVCTEVLKFLGHQTTVVLDEPGEYTLRVDGRRIRYGDDVWEEPISAAKTVVVR